MNKLMLALASMLVLSACNTAEGVKKDVQIGVEATGNAIKKGGEAVGGAMKKGGDAVERAVQ